MKREYIKVGQQVSFYFSGARHPDAIGSKGHARTVIATVYKIHRVSIEVEEKINGGFCIFYKKPSELEVISEVNDG